MTVTVNIDSNIEQFAKDARDLFELNVPLVINQMTNDVATDIQRRLRDSTIPNAWTTRNRQLPKAMTVFIGGRANLRKGKHDVLIGPAKSRVNGHIAGSGFAERNVTGARKTPKGKRIAIPQEGPGLRRLKSGSISKAKKPKANPKLVKIRTRKGKELLIEPRKRKIVKNGKVHRGITRYVLTPQAQGTRRLGRFFPDAFQTGLRVYEGHFDARMRAAVARRAARSFTYR